MYGFYLNGVQGSLTHVGTWEECAKTAKLMSREWPRSTVRWISDAEVAEYHKAAAQELEAERGYFRSVSAS